MTHYSNTHNIKVQGPILHITLPRYSPEIEHYDRTNQRIESFSDEARARLRKELELFDFTGKTIIQFICSYSDKFRPDNETDKKIRKLFFLRVCRTLADPWIFWKREFQENGSPHYHVVIDITGHENQKDFLIATWLHSVAYYMGEIPNEIYDNMVYVHSQEENYIECYDLDKGKFTFYLSTHFSKGKQNYCPVNYSGRFYGYCNKTKMPVYPIKKYIAPPHVICTLSGKLNAQKREQLKKKNVDIPEYMIFNRFRLPNETIIYLIGSYKLQEAT